MQPKNSHDKLTQIQNQIRSKTTQLAFSQKAILNAD